MCNNNGRRRVILKKLQKQTCEMSNMSLVLINSESNQQIPLGTENPLIIGRHNVLGCFNKKVSRTHGRITCTENGKINLVALHTNPCFFMRNGVPPIRQLNKDEEETLNEGDCLGLLPNSFWFQISSSDIKIKKESEGTNDSCGDLENLKEISANKSETEKAELSAAESSDYSKRIGSPEFEKTKRLPLSMYDTYEFKLSDKSSSIDDNDTKTKKIKLDTDCDLSNLCMQNSDSNDKDTVNEKGASTFKVCNEETLTNCIKSIERTNNQENKEIVEETRPDQSFKRPICQYEHDCFRKNPQHKLEFCHPNDSDYVPYEKRPLCQYGEACYRRNERHRVEFRHVGSPGSSFASSSHSPPSSIGEERPPCFGGSHCYNRNPQHRKDLYHPPKGYACHFSFESSSSSEGFEIYEDYLAKEYDSDFASPPLPPKRRRKKVKRDSEYEDEDEYDLEDPFVNDASSDEYVLSESNSEEDLDES